MLGAYGRYKKVRDASWKALVDNDIDALPIDVVKIAVNNGITLLKNTDVKILNSNEMGISTYDGEWFIVYDDSIDSAEQKRFTIAHELGHILLGHPLVVGYHRSTVTTVDSRVSPIESAANTFAARLLAPACVLWGLNCHSADEIVKSCLLPTDYAKKRAERMRELYNRGKFLTSPLERKVYERFKDYIEANKGKF